MFRDTDKALARLEAELLQEEEDSLLEEEYDEEPEEDEVPAPPEYFYEDTRPSRSAGRYQNYANGYRAYNADLSDEDPEEYSRELLEDEEPGSSNTVPILIACLLSLTLAAVVLILTLMSRGIV